MIFYSFTILAQVAPQKVILFDSDDTINMTLEFDISYFREHREELRDKGVNGSITLENGNVIPVEILSRGQGSMENTNPPYKLKFKQENSQNTIFQNIKKIKSFPNPEGDSEAGEKYVMSNYLIYRLLEIYYPYHFKTRMVEINYKDTAKKIEPFTSRTFLLEPNKVTAKRYDMINVNFENDPDADDGPACNASEATGNVENEILEKMTAFQFLIGNADHAIPGYQSEMFQGIASSEKNMKMLKGKDGKYYPIAYDFDLSGMIDRNCCFIEFSNSLLKPERQDQIPIAVCDREVIKKRKAVYS